MHTSACTVAVLPEVPEAEQIEINPSELKIDTFRASGAGGQHVNKTDSAIRITHLPTGLVVECRDERSQHKNRAKAMSVLSARLQAAEDERHRAAEQSTRRNLVGSGDRSERIRTYNYPQGRLSEHRINLTLYRLGEIMEGDRLRHQPDDPEYQPTSSPPRREQLMQIQQARAHIMATLAGGIPRADADALLCHLLECRRSYLMTSPERELDAAQLATLQGWLERRLNGEPIAHLIGEREFWSLPLKVSPATLIPRPDTEVLVEQALARLPAGPSAVLDLGTGTGAIALALKSERPDADVWAVDRMPAAAAPPVPTAPPSVCPSRCATVAGLSRWSTPRQARRRALR